MTFQSIHWTILLCLPTEAPALIDALRKMTVEQIEEAVAHDVAICAKVCPGHPDYQEAQWIMDHIIALSNDELETRA